MPVGGRHLPDQLLLFRRQVKFAILCLALAVLIKSHGYDRHVSLGCHLFGRGTDHLIFGYQAALNEIVLSHAGTTMKVLDDDFVRLGAQGHDHMV